MGGDTQTNHSRPRRKIKANVKVKSGCRTCRYSPHPYFSLQSVSSSLPRIRKVKCDEGRPACLRCLTTGRVCDGYGVWGGGGNFYGARQPSILSQPPLSISVLAASTEEKRYYEWFTCRTVKKIPGFFVLTFWNTLLLQASLNEPAVLHAVLTLSSVHKREILVGKVQGGSDDETVPFEQEQFMLSQYVKAIGHLQPHFENKEKGSVRVALITCVVFICLEFLRGHFRTGQKHLENGLKILREMYGGSGEDEGVLAVEAIE